MSKAILEFNLDEPEDIEAFKRVSKALDLALALHTLDEKFRDHERNATPAVTRDTFHNVLSHYGINLDDLIT